MTPENLIQLSNAVEIVRSMSAYTESYARVLIYFAAKSGTLKIYPRRLQYGKRSINLYEPNEVRAWMERRSSTVDKS